MKIFIISGACAAFFFFLAPDCYGQTFNEVPESHWAYPYIEELAARGITGGCGGGSFCPDGTVTRAQMAVFLIRSMSGQHHHKFVSVPGNAFKPFLPGIGERTVFYGTDGSIGPWEMGDGFNYAPVLLPDLARVKNMKCWLFDPDPTGYIEASLVRHAFGDQDPMPDVIAMTSTSPATVMTSVVEQTATPNSSFSLVDNASYSYYLIADFHDVSVLGNGITLRGCSIEIDD